MDNAETNTMLTRSIQDSSEPVIVQYKITYPVTLCVIIFTPYAVSPIVLKAAFMKFSSMYGSSCKHNEMLISQYVNGAICGV